MKNFASKINSRIAYETVRRLQEHAVSHPNTRAIYDAIGVLADRYGYRGQHLAAAEHKVFSQNGEDGVIAEIFHRIGTESKFFVEFGVETGSECNTRCLADVLGWEGVYFEADETNFQRLSARFRSNQRVATFHGHVTPETINERFQLAQVPAGDVPFNAEDDAESLAHLMAEAVVDTASRRKKQQDGQRLAASFTWRRTAEETGEVYREFAQSGRIA